MSDKANKQIVFLNIFFGIVGVSIIGIPLFRLYRHFANNRRSSNYIDDLRTLVKNFTPPDIPRLEQELNFPLKMLTTSLSLSEFHKLIANRLKSSELLSIDEFKIVGDNHLVLVGRFHSSELFTGKNESSSLPKALICAVLFKKENDLTLQCYGKFPEDKTHDFFYSDLFHKLDDCIKQA